MKNQLLYAAKIRSRIISIFGDLLEFPNLENELMGNGYNALVTTSCPIHGTMLANVGNLIRGNSLACKKCNPFLKSFSIRFGKEPGRVELLSLYKFVKREKSKCANSQIRGMSKLVDGVDFEFWYEKFKNSHGYVPKRRVKIGIRSMPRRGRYLACSNSADALRMIKAVHGDSFDFPKIHDEFRNNTSPLTAVCMVHGTFLTNLTKAASQSRGCRYCISEKKKCTKIVGKEKSTEMMNRYYDEVRTRKILASIPVFESTPVPTTISDTFRDILNSYAVSLVRSPDEPSHDVVESPVDQDVETVKAEVERHTNESVEPEKQPELSKFYLNPPPVNCDASLPHETVENLFSIVGIDDNVKRFVKLVFEDESASGKSVSKVLFTLDFKTDRELTELILDDESTWTLTIPMKVIRL